MRTIVMIIGIILTAWTVLSIVRTMLIPNGAQSVLGTVISSAMKSLGYLPLALLKTYSRQNKWLVYLAPLSLLIHLLCYVAILIFTTGLVVFGSTELSMLDAMYQSGATLTTLGIVVPVNVSSAITVMFAAFLGLVVIAIFIGYLLAIYNALVSRESPMARLSILAGVPAWGPEILARGYAIGLPTDEGPDAREWTNWTSDLLLNQLVNPVLMQFRSTSASRHWVVSLLAVLDAAALKMSFTRTIDPHDIQLLTQGGVTLSVLSQASPQIHDWDLQKEIFAAVSACANESQLVDSNQNRSKEIDNPPTSRKPNPASGLSHAEWQQAIDNLATVGYPLPTDLEQAFHIFANIRATYAPNAYVLAKALHAVPAPWSGPRHPHIPIQWPELATGEDIQ